MKKCLFGLIVIFTVNAFGADFTISIKPKGQKFIAYKKSNNLKLGEVVLFPGGSSYIKTERGDLMAPHFGSGLYFASLTDCQNNSGPKYIFAGVPSGVVFQNAANEEFLKTKDSTQSLLTAYYYEHGNGCSFIDSESTYRQTELVSPATGLPNLGSSIGFGVNDSEHFTIKAE